MVRFWFTSDMHFAHANIIKLCNRPFNNLQDMEYHLITNWNSRVKPEDTVFHIGDFCFKGNLAKPYIEKLNGNIVFIKGNHDRNNGLNTPIERIYIHYGGKDLCLVHRPEDADWNVSLNLVGHVHNKWKFKREIFREQAISIDDHYDMCNVSVEVWKYHPVSIQEILKEYDKWKYKISLNQK